MFKFKFYLSCFKWLINVLVARISSSNFTFLTREREKVITRNKTSLAAKTDNITQFQDQRENLEDNKFFSETLYFDSIFGAF